MLGPGEISVLATLQQSFVTVYRRARVAIITTGDELVEIEDPVGPGQIVNGNTAALAAFCRAHGAEPLMLPIARDDMDDIRRTIETALDADFILSSGGVSVGDFDFVKQVLDEMQAKTIFWRVAMKPGKPLLFCTIGSTPYFWPARQSRVEHDVVSAVCSTCSLQGGRLSTHRMAATTGDSLA